MHARVKNVGTGIVPVEIAATRGERFPKKRTTDNAWPTRARGRDARRRRGEAGDHPLRVRARAAWSWTPTCTVLMLERQKAEQKLKAPPGDTKLAWVVGR